MVSICGREFPTYHPCLLLLGHVGSCEHKDSLCRENTEREARDNFGELVVVEVFCEKYEVLLNNVPSPHAGRHVGLYFSWVRDGKGRRRVERRAVWK